MKNEHPIDFAHEVIVLILENCIASARVRAPCLKISVIRKAFFHPKSMTNPTPFQRPKRKNCCPAATVAIEVIFAAFGHGPIAPRLPRHHRRLRRHWLAQGGSWRSQGDPPGHQWIPTSGDRLQAISHFSCRCGMHDSFDLL